MKKLYFLLFLMPLFSPYAHAQWNTSGNDIWNSNVGNVSVGNNAASFPAKFNVYLSVPLGQTLQNNTMLSSIAGSSGNNTFKNNLWLVRNTAGTDWVTARLHDGISIDVSYLSPQVNTKTWWERDPYNDIQSWGNSANTYLTINRGNVAIGTPDPHGYKLAVNGSVIATSVTVKINSAWPDFVFKKDYHLYPLNILEAYIWEHGHLPEIPTEREIAENGLNLGEINRVLVNKVEELTLYLIEEHQKNVEQSTNNQLLKSKLMEQQKAIDLIKAQLATLVKN